MQNKNRLTVHTTLCPGNEQAPCEKKASLSKENKLPENKKTHSSRKVSASERLFRNTAVACALLLTIMALNNIDTPVTNRITGAIKNVVSMNMNLPSSIGNLSFVQKLMPESALVFLNMTETSRQALPVKGEIVHSYSKAQPWTEYKTESGASVYSLSSGKTEACMQTDDGDYTILIKNTDGTECLYGFLKTALVKEGDAVHAGTEIGTTGENENARLYFEIRQNGTPIDPGAISER